MENKDRLITYMDANPKVLEDLMLIMARNMESAFILAGAEAGKDYTVKDLFELAQPFALHVFKKSDTEFTI